ncbi:Tetraspannin domain-containing protein [Cephalotus follicularis]|uniref:Tetraspannin domain-containing protein n=1 Tax=Cephalotus follicularis TaxID=3775 RepID=A0A1Q3B740_CEPFO|nr:Tetraspannin domain-containing protein [Cephalotus follicularis]
MENPLLITGNIFSIVSLLRLIGLCCKSNIVMWIYWFVMVLLIIVLMEFTIFTFYVTNEKAGMMLTRDQRISSREDTRHWLQRHFISGENWYKIRSCLVDVQVCKSLANFVDQTHEDFNTRKLSPIHVLFL